MSKPHDDERNQLFTEFFHLHVAQIRAYTRSHLPNHSDLEDVCADAFALAWSHLDELCELSDAQAHRWLQRVVTFRISRTSRDFVRHGRAIQKISRQVAKQIDTPESTFMAGLDHLTEQTASSLVIKLLNQLSEDQRQLLTWDIYDNLSGPEIAKRLNCSPTAARLRLMRARRALAESFKSESDVVYHGVAE